METRTSGVDDSPADAELLAALKEHRPFKIKATLADGTDRSIAVPQATRKRWSVVLGTLAAIEWCKLELLNSDGDLLGVIEAADSRSQRAIELDGFPKSPAGEVGRLIVHAQDMSLTHYHKAMQTIVDGFGNMVKQQHDRLEKLERQVADTLELVQAAAATLNPTPQVDSAGTPAEQIVAKVVAAWAERHGLLPAALPILDASPPPAAVPGNGGGQGSQGAP